MIRSFVMLFILIALTAAMCSLAWGAGVKLRWNPNPEPDIAGYRLYQLGEPNVLLVQTGKVTTVTVAAEEGGMVALSAFNAAGAESDLSAPVTVAVRSPRLPQDGLVVTASSEETMKEDNRAVLAADGNDQTMWHTTWGLTLPPHFLLIEMPRPAMISGMSYLPRQDGGTNGVVTGYEVETSMDGIEWTTAAAGTWANNASEKYAALPLSEAKFVRLWGRDPRMAAAEVTLHGVYVPLPPKTLTLTLQQSEDLTDWTDLSDHVVPLAEPKQFFRLKIEPTPTP